MGGQAHNVFPPMRTQHARSFALTLLFFLLACAVIAASAWVA